MEEILVKRSDKVSFLDVDGTLTRMTGFTSLSQNKNPKEYSRQYVDEEFENTDVTGYSPDIDFGFDQYKNNAVHDKLVEILDGEKTGADAIVTIVTVDFSQPVGSSYIATKRNWSVMGDTEGDSMDAYTYSGSFRVKTSRIEGVAASTDGFKTCTFAEGTSL